MRALLWIALAFVAAPSAAGFASAGGYPLELFSHFRPQFFAGALAIAAAFLALKDARAAAVSAALALVNAAAIFLPLMSAAPHAPATEHVRVVWANLEYAPDALAAIAALAEKTDADIIALTELPNGDTRWAQEALPRYPGAVSAPENSVFSIALHARSAFADGGAIVDMPADWSHAARWAQTPDDVRVIALHPTPPVGGVATMERDAVIAAAARDAAAAPVSLLVGDFNATPWSRVMIGLKKAGLRRVDCGAPWASTWRSKLPLAGIPIDHAYIGSDVRGATCRVGPDIGSDHYPLIIDLALN